MPPKIYLTALLMLFSSLCLMGQIGKGLEIESLLYLGRPVKHTPKLFFDINQNSIGAEVNFKFQTYGKKPWHQLRGYPQFGIAFNYFKIGESAVLGESISLVPNLTIYILKKEKFNVNFQIGNGITYMTKHYDVIDNPTNNALGSAINSFVGLKFNLSAYLTKNWTLVASTAFNHASNGASQLPNFGINIPAFGLGINYKPNPLKSEDYITHDISNIPERRIGLNVFAHLGYREAIVAGGPRYPVYSTSIAGTYNINKVNRFMLGIEYEYNKSIRAFGEHVEAFVDDRDARKRSSRTMLFVANEFLFGNIGILLQLGTYISPNAYLIPFPVYTKLSTRYYLPAIGRLKTKFYVGVFLKSHKVNAEYIAFGAGATF